MSCQHRVSRYYTSLRVHHSSNDVLQYEIEAGGTQFEGPTASRSAFETLWQANPWMIFRNTGTNVLHWDFVRGFSSF